MGGLEVVARGRVGFGLWAKVGSDERERDD